jgi:hypothetical protein
MIQKIKCFLGRHEWYIWDEKDNKYILVCPQCGELIIYDPDGFFKQFHKGKIDPNKVSKDYIINNYERY